MKEVKMICVWCNREITEEPFVKKQYPSLSIYPVYHIHCFVIAHRAHLNQLSADKMINIITGEEINLGDCEKLLNQGRMLL